MKRIICSNKQRIWHKSVRKCMSTFIGCNIIKIKRVKGKIKDKIRKINNHCRIQRMWIKIRTKINKCKEKMQHWSNKFTAYHNKCKNSSQCTRQNFNASKATNPLHNLTESHKDKSQFHVNHHHSTPVYMSETH